MIEMVLSQKRQKWKSNKRLLNFETSQKPSKKAKDKEKNMAH
jgi:hypothetical protein